MPSLSMTKDDDQPGNALPPLPAGHGFVDGQRVRFRVWGRGLVEGTVQQIDITFAGKRYKGLAILGDDQRYYQLDPDVAETI